MKLIDADPLIKWCVYCADDDIIKVDRHVMASMLDHAPEIDPVKHGYWKNVKKEAIIPTGECSRCGKWERVNNFCPNCGARMDGDIEWMS